MTLSEVAGCNFMMSTAYTQHEFLIFVKLARKCDSQLRSSSDYV